MLVQTGMTRIVEKRQTIRRGDFNSRDDENCKCGNDSGSGPSVSS